MRIIGIDDTDSRTGGMCTTWIASEIVRRVPDGSVEGTYLVRLCPSIEHKTRGNGAVAIVTDAEDAFEMARKVVDTYAVQDDPRTNPGVVGIDVGEASRADMHTFGRTAIRARVTRATADERLSGGDATVAEWGNGRGVIGATAAVGAVGGHLAGDPAFTDWTYEHIGYRESNRWGTDREVALPPSLPAAPAVWDTRDATTGARACVPRSPCPVLLGVRGDRPSAIDDVLDGCGGEPIERVHRFITNQGTDGHVRPSTIGDIRAGRSYRITGVITHQARTKEGGHVVVEIADGTASCECIAFAPTGRFRDVVRRLVPGDAIIACGEVGRGTIKLEKLAITARALTTTTVPRCRVCERSMSSAGADQGYRCRACGTKRPGKRRVTTDRDLAPGWYEVPPDARRHLAEPLVRSDYELPVHPTSG